MFPLSVLKKKTADPNLTLAFRGYIDEFRIRKEAMYDGDFTPPSSAFTF